jgi:arylformamidase
MRIYDVSVTIRPDMVVWPGDDAVRIEPVRSQDDGSRANVSNIRMNLHTGTHVDSPGHFIAGASTVESLPLDVLIGRAWVAELDSSGAITAADLVAAGIPLEARRVLLKTHNSALQETHPDQFCPDFAHLTEDAARWVVARGIRLIGVDYLSVESPASSGEVHTALLEAGIVIVETLNLADVSPGWYDLYCLPLKVRGGDGAPARVVLISHEAVP